MSKAEREEIRHHYVVMQSQSDHQPARPVAVYGSLDAAGACVARMLMRITKGQMDGGCLPHVETFYIEDVGYHAEDRS